MILFEGRRQVQFFETDPQGYIFYSRLFEWAHAALEQFVSASTLGWPKWFQNPDWAAPVRHAEADYKHPIRAGETYLIYLARTKTGNSSVEFVFTARTEDEVCATVKFTVVFINRQTGHPREIPPEVRSILAD